MAQNPVKRAVAPVLSTLGRRRAARLFPDAPVLIGGCGRSGTTLMLSVLSAHPRIHAIPHEVGMLTEWELGSADHAWSPVRMDRFHRYVLRATVSESARRFCEKTPRNVRWIEPILDYYGPEARFIHMIRDPRDVLTSRHPKRSGEFWVSVDRYVADVKAGLAFDDHDQVLAVRYEDLVERYEDTIRRICDFLGEECLPEMMDWHTHASVRRNRAWSGPVEALHARSVGRWRRDDLQERVADIMSRDDLVRLMERLDYRD